MVAHYSVAIMTNITTMMMRPIVYMTPLTMYNYKLLSVTLHTGNIMKELDASWYLYWLIIGYTIAVH